MSRRNQLSQLRKSRPAVLPSLLQCDFGNLEREIRKLEKSGVAALHLDVMDGVFVPNLTYGMPIVKAVRGLTDLPLDVHLMIAHPDQYVEPFVEAGADLITFHVESVEAPRPLLERIRELGVGAGITLNPGTPLTRIEHLLDACDLVLIMSVVAGFGGQTFNELAIDRLRRVRELVDSNVLVAVDGGINEHTIGRCAGAGAQLFVVGSAIFRHDEYSPAVSRLVELAAA